MAKSKKSKKKKATKKKAQAASSRKVSHAGARKKGHDFERWIANEIGHVFPEAKRHLEYQADEAMKGIDLVGTGAYAIQAKNLQNYVSIKTIREVERTKENRPVLITKGNKMEPVAVLFFSDFVKMLEEIRGREEYEAKWDDAQTIQLQNFVEEVSKLPAVDLMSQIDMPKVVEECNRLGILPVDHEEEVLRGLDTTAFHKLNPALKFIGETPEFIEPKPEVMEVEKVLDKLNGEIIDSLGVGKFI